MEPLFSIVSKCDEEIDVEIFNRCVDSIIKFHPESEIIIVDSGSKIRTQYDRFRNNEKIHIEEINNKNYETGAIWYVYENYINDTYVFLQDSMEICEPLTRYFIYDVVYMTNDSGWPDIENIEHVWAREQMENIDYNFIERDRGYTMFRYNSGILKRNTLTKLKEKKLNTLLPTHKRHSQAMERIFAMCLHHEGYDVSCPKMRPHYYKKIGRNRQ